MMWKGFIAFAMSALLADPAWPASVEVRPFGERGGQTVYALVLAGEITASDDLRVASLLGEALVEDRFPGFLVLNSGGGNTEASLGIARIAHDYGVPVLVRHRCLSGCAIIALSAWRGRLFVIEFGRHWTASVLGRRGLRACDPIVGRNTQGCPCTAQLRRAQVGRREDDANAAAGYDISQRRRAEADRRAGEAPSLNSATELSPGPICPSSPGVGSSGAVPVLSRFGRHREENAESLGKTGAARED